MRSFIHILVKGSCVSISISGRIGGWWTVGVTVLHWRRALSLRKTILNELIFHGTGVCLHAQVYYVSAITLTTVPPVTP